MRQIERSSPISRGPKIIRGSLDETDCNPRPSCDDFAGCCNALNERLLEVMKPGKAKVAQEVL